IDKLDKAVAAAHTFFQANPDHMEMKQNLEYYRMMARVEEENFKDLEAKPHMMGNSSITCPAKVLNCKQHCPVELASTAGREGPFEDFLPSHFNYLQFSYYNSKFISLFLFIISTPCAVIK
ncbi:hypothetical protein XENOCAPTIV_020486, partial [Xenoophorus captivus]